MKLHRALRSDWSEVAPQQRTLWQRCAACSHGIVTPGNLITLIGAILVLRGLYDLAHAQLITGVAMLLIGRMADIFDGMVADYTKTKSPLGEAVDAATDKVLTILALYVLLDKSLIPIVIGIVMVVHALYNIALTAVARRLRVSLHPSPTGKLSALFEWACVGLYVLSDILHQQHHSTTAARVIALFSFGLFIITATWSSLNYTRSVYYKRVMRS
jgi:phosphatidylglycerophosphate synthase